MLYYSANADNGIDCMRANRPDLSKSRYSKIHMRRHDGSKLYITDDCNGRFTNLGIDPGPFFNPEIPGL